MNQTAGQRHFLALFVIVGCLLRAGVASAQPGTWINNGPPGGNILAFAVDPFTPTTVYAGTEFGGVFRSTDAGGHWRPINTGLVNAHVTAL
jgi:hypothetical protein